MPHNLFNTLQSFAHGKFYSLPQLEKENIGPVSKLPVSIRIVLESVLRNVDGKKITEADVRNLANWQPNAPRTEEIPFVVSRILLQDFTGVPLLVDLAAMRSAIDRSGKDPSLIEPLVPVDLVVDHSVQVDHINTPDAMQKNMDMEFARNGARYEFLKWGTQAFDTFKIVPPGIGICHQVNLEYLAKGIFEKEGIYYPDSLVGTDSHTTMINGLGIVGWGVGGIEAESGMLGQPIYFLTPDVVGVHMTGALQEGMTATDLVLHCTELLRKTKVVGIFVEFHGDGAATLSVSDRATIANMAPEYGATIGYFPFDEKSCEYLLATGRDPQFVNIVREYYKAQGLFGIPRKGECQYSKVLEVDLSQVQASVAGPKRPQDRIDLSQVKDRFLTLLQKPVAENGYGKSDSEKQQRITLQIGIPTKAPLKQLAQPLTGGGEQAQETTPIPVNHVSNSKTNTNTLTENEMMNNRPTPDPVEHVAKEEYPLAQVDLGHGDVVIAAITSCTNTSNPSVMLAAGLLAKKAYEKGLRTKPSVKTSLAPGSRVVTEYYESTGLQKYLDALGFYHVGYGCTTCIGNSGPLEPHIEDAITKNDFVVASVLSGNRNFEARVHQSVKANFLMSPPLVVAYALAGRIDIDLTREPLGKDKQGKDVFLKDIWPTMKEIHDLMAIARDPKAYQKVYSSFAGKVPLWEKIPAPTGATYEWDPDSTYIQEPPFFENFSMTPEAIKPVRSARALAIFGDSITTDHISPAGAIKVSSPAGKYLLENGVKFEEFNSYGSRRGNDRIMTRGTFANVRIRNLMVPQTEGGVTIYHPDGIQMSIYDASMQYQKENVPLIIFAGQEYGTGSSRDWAAKGTRLLGVRVVIAQSFERIHRSNLVGMGVLPCQFKDDMNAQKLNLDGSETFDLEGIEGPLKVKQELKLVIKRKNQTTDTITVIARLDTPIEIDYYKHGGILPYVLKQILS